MNRITPIIPTNMKKDHEINIDYNQVRFHKPYFEWCVIQTHTSKKSNNNQDQQQVSKEIQSYSYGSNFKKLIISILSISWIILPWYTFKYFGFYDRYYYESFNNRTNPIISKDSFGILMFGFQLLISTFSIIVMEISKIL
ncbi:hypothetical protein ACTFIY_003890 [Dictyostelium cf. discoideum]